MIQVMRSPGRGIAMLETALFLLVMFTLAFGGWGLLAYQWEKNKLAEIIDRRAKNFRDRGYHSSFSLVHGTGGCLGVHEIQNATEIADELALDLSNSFESYGSGSDSFWLEVGFGCFRINPETGEPFAVAGRIWKTNQLERRGSLSVPADIMARTDFLGRLDELAAKRRSDGTSFWAATRGMLGRSAAQGQYRIGTFVVLVRAVRKVDAGPIQVLKNILDFDPYISESRVVIIR